MTLFRNPVGIGGCFYETRNLGSKIRKSESLLGTCVNFKFQGMFLGTQLFQNTGTLLQKHKSTYRDYGTFSRYLKKSSSSRVQVLDLGTQGVLDQVLALLVRRCCFNNLMQLPVKRHEGVES